MDGQITLLAGSTFEEFVDRHRHELIRTLTLTGGDLGAAAAAVDEALFKIEPRWDRITEQDDPTNWVLRRAFRSMTPSPESSLLDPASSFAAMPLDQRLDVALVNHLGWTPSRRAAVGAALSPHADAHAQLIADMASNLPAIPARPQRAPTSTAKVVGIVAALGVALVAVVAAGQLGRLGDAAPAATLPPLTQPGPVAQDRTPRLLGREQLMLTPMAGVLATDFVQAGDVTVGFADTDDGIKAWTTSDGRSWTDHGVVLEADGRMTQATEGGPGVLMVTREPNRDLLLPAKTRLWSSEDGLSWEEHQAPPIDTAEWLEVKASTERVTVIGVVEDPHIAWRQRLLDALDPIPQTMGKLYGTRVDGDDLIILGPFGGPADRIPLAELGITANDSRIGAETGSLWMSSDMLIWEQIDDPLASERLPGVGLPSGDVAIPAANSSVGYLMVDADGGVIPISASRFVSGLEAYGEGVIGVSGAFPVAHVVTSVDLDQWRQITPDLAGVVHGSFTDVRVAAGPGGVMAVFADTDWDPPTSDTIEMDVDGVHIDYRTVDGRLTLSRGGREIAQLLSIYDERLVKHTFGEPGTVTFLHPTTEEPMVTITFEQAKRLDSHRFVDRGFSSRLAIVYSDDEVEWSVEADGNNRLPGWLGDLHVGDGFVVFNTLIGDALPQAASVYVGVPSG